MSEGMVDPNDPEYDKPSKRFWMRDGRKLFQIVGMERKDTAKGNPGLTLFAVCLEDPAPPDPTLEPQSDEGLLSRLRFTLSPGGGMSFFVRAVKAFDYTQPFNPHDDAQIQAIFYDKVFAGTVQSETVGNKTYTEIVDTKIYPGVFKPEWKDRYNSGIDSYQEMLTHQADKAAKEQRGGGGGRGGGRGGGNRGGRGGGGSDQQYGF